MVEIETVQVEEDGVLPVGDGRHFQNGVLPDRSVMPGEFTERTLVLPDARENPALDDDFGPGRHPQVHRLGLGQFQGLPKKPADHGEFIHLHGAPGLRAVTKDGMMAQSHGEFQILPSALVRPQNVRQVGLGSHDEAHLLRTLVHQPIDPGVMDSGLRILCDSHARRDIGSRILLAVGDDGECGQVRLRGEPPDLLDRPVLHPFRLQGPALQSDVLIQHFIEGGLQRGRQFRPGSEQVCQHRHREPFRILEQDGREFVFRLKLADNG